MAHKQISLLILKADSRNWLCKLDLSYQLLLVVPELDQAFLISCDDQLFAIVDVDRCHSVLMLLRSVALNLSEVVIIPKEVR